MVRADAIALSVPRTVRSAETPLWDMLARNLAQEGGHFDGCHGRFGSFVAHFATGAFNCLFDGFGRDDTKDARNTRLDPDLGDPRGDARCHVVVMTRRTTDHTTQCDDCLVAAAFGELFGDDG